MIASNYRKHPEALALQLPLPFGWILKWATSKPTTKALRAIRTARGKAFAALGRIAHPVKPTTPQWAKDAARRARQLAASVKAACLDLVELDGVIHTPAPATMQYLSVSLCLTPVEIDPAHPVGDFLDSPEYKLFCSSVHKTPLYRWGKNCPYWGGHSA